MHFRKVAAKYAFVVRAMVLPLKAIDAFVIIHRSKSQARSASSFIRSLSPGGQEVSV